MELLGAGSSKGACSGRSASDRWAESASQIVGQGGAATFARQQRGRGGQSVGRSRPIRASGLVVRRLVRLHAAPNNRLQLSGEAGLVGQEQDATR